METAFYNLASLLLLLSTVKSSHLVLYCSIQWRLLLTLLRYAAVAVVAEVVVDVVVVPVSPLSLSLSLSLHRALKTLSAVAAALRKRRRRRSSREEEESTEQGTTQKLGRTQRSDQNYPLIAVVDGGCCVCVWLLLLLLLLLTCFQTMTIRQRLPKEKGTLPRPRHSP